MKTLTAFLALALPLLAADDSAKPPKPPRPPTTDYALLSAKALHPTRTIIYKTVGTRQLEMDLFEPKGYAPTDRRPCFLAIHGGGWTAGTPDVMYCVAAHFAEHGWLGISVRYRLHRPDKGTTIFDSVADVRSAMRYLRSHAAELGINPQQIVAGGRSAGGHLAAAAALFDGMDEPGEDTKVSCRPDALALFSAVLDTSDKGYGQATIGERWAEVSPVLHVKAGLPPTIVLHGGNDTTAPVAGARQFAEAMQKAGNASQLIELARGGHSYMMRKETLFLEAMQQTRDFLAGQGIRDPGL